ncbi:hypothetical protein KI387_022537, partial [Taxus chinensis]
RNSVRRARDRHQFRQRSNPLPPSSAASPLRYRAAAATMPTHEHSETEPEPSPTHSENGTDSKGAVPYDGTDKEDDNEEYVLVNLSAIREEMQCPICLGIIRKTRTVMECLHRFCRDCIDKSMRLGNNECPACRTHCASRRSLRDDPNYDALIAAIYPDLDKYEEEEMALHEEEEHRNRQIQASIADTFRRQSEAITRRRRTAKATAAAFVRKAHGKFSGVQGQSKRNNRGKRPRRSLATDGDEGEDVKQFFSDDEEPQHRRLTRKKRRAPSSLPETSADMDVGNGEEPDDIDDEEAGEDIQSAEYSQAEASRESTDASPGNARNAEGLAWGKGGARSHTKNGSVRNAHARTSRTTYAAKMVDYLLAKSRQEKETQFDIHFTLLPFEDEEEFPSLKRPYLSCQPTVTVKHICKFLSSTISVAPEDLEIVIEKQISPLNSAKFGKGKALVGTSNGEKVIEILDQQATLEGIFAGCTERRGNL